MKLRPFELTLVIIFCGLAIVAVFLLSALDGSSGKVDDDVIVIGAVSIWGTLPQSVMQGVLDEESLADDAYEKVTYRYISPTQFDATLTNALADSEGPDLIIVSQEKLVELRKRIQPVSYEFFPIRDIKNSYLDGAQIFALDDGLYSFPIAVDPLMMYWNRDILATEGMLSSPATWEELINSAFGKLIMRDFDRTIQRGVVAMGEYDNVRNSFGIISALLIQSGSDLVQIDKDGRYQVRLQFAGDEASDPLKTSVDFYTRFSQPSNALYSWNRSFEEDRLEFLSENLALYFGYGSEGSQMERLNPNLNFDIAEIPQGATDTIRRTYGKFYGLSMLKASTNAAGANIVMSSFASQRIADRIAVDSNMVPLRRSSVAAGSNDTYGRINYMSASIALGWLNPKLEVTNVIFSKMTQDVNENRRDSFGAASDASARLSNSF
jgi:ABC-type glycerol-3-phosphate transport system substrate-binding protein